MIECKGRNGYFKLAGDEVWKAGKNFLVVELKSKRPPRNLGPIVIQGTKEELTELFQGLLVAVRDFPGGERSI